MPHRPERVREFIKEQVSDIIRHAVKDPRIGFVSVTDVEVSVDLRHAKVFVSVLGDAQAKADTMAGLESAQGFVRGELGRRLQMWFTPEILFRLDESIERGTRIVTLIHEVAKDTRHDRTSTPDRGKTPEKP